MSADDRTLQQRVGTRIRAARDALGLSQEHVARRVGMTRSSIANLEAGRQDMNISRLALVAAAVNLNLADLIQPGDLPELAPLPPPPHDVTVQHFFTATCETCEGLVLACDPDKAKVQQSKRDHIAAEREGGARA